MAGRVLGAVAAHTANRLPQDAAQAAQRQRAQRLAQAAQLTGQLCLHRMDTFSSWIQPRHDFCHSQASHAKMRSSRHKLSCGLTYRSGISNDAGVCLFRS